MPYGGNELPWLRYTLSECFYSSHVGQITFCVQLHPAIIKPMAYSKGQWHSWDVFASFHTTMHVIIIQFTQSIISAFFFVSSRYSCCFRGSSGCTKYNNANKSVISCTELSTWSTQRAAVLWVAFPVIPSPGSYSAKGSSQCRWAVARPGGLLVRWSGAHWWVN